MTYERQHHMTAAGPVDFTDEEQAAWEADQAAFEAGQLPAARAWLIQHIDAQVDALYEWAIGKRGPEYERAEADARAFKAVDYTGAVPRSVQCWATATGQTAQWAADNIIARADVLRDVQEDVRENRLIMKTQAANAENEGELDTIRAAWEAFGATVRQTLGG